MFSQKVINTNSVPTEVNSTLELTTTLAELVKVLNVLQEPTLSFK